MVVVVVVVVVVAPRAVSLLVLSSKRPNERDEDREKRDRNGNSPRLVVSYRPPSPSSFLLVLFLLRVAPVKSGKSGKKHANTRERERHKRDAFFIVLRWIILYKSSLLFLQSPSR